MGKRFSKIMSLILACMIGASLAACRKESSENPQESSQPQVQKYTVSVTGGTGSGSYDEGTEATVIADEAQDGYRFIGWYSGDEKVSSAYSYTFTVNKDVTLAAKCGDYSGSLEYTDKFDTEKQNYWDGGEWANCQGEMQTTVANSADGAYKFSMKTADEEGNSLLPSEFTLPDWWTTGKDSVWVTSAINFDEAKDLTSSTIEFDIKFNNMSKGVTVLAKSGKNKAYESYVVVNKKNFNGNADSWASFVNVTELADGWYHYEYDFAKFAIIDDDAEGSKATILSECDELDFIFLNGCETYGNELCKNVDYTEESKVYVDNLYIYEKAIERVTLTVTGGEGSGKYKKGSDVTITATVPAGSAFVGWYNGDKKVSDDEEYTVNLTADTTLVAKYIDDDYSMNLTYYDVVNLERKNSDGQVEPNYWDGGEWASCKGEVQKTVTNGSDYAYKFSLKTADANGTSLLPADYTVPSWWDGKSDIWCRNTIDLDSLDLTNSIVSFDVKFDNMAKGVTLMGVSNEKTTWENWVAVDGKNFNGSPDAGASYVRVTDLGNCWYHYEYDFAQFATVDDDTTGTKANVVEECEKFMFIFLNGGSNFASEYTKGVDYTKESAAYIDNLVILDKDEIDLAKGLSVVHGKVETVESGYNSNKCIKYTLDKVKNNNVAWDVGSITIDSTDMAGKKVVFDVKFDNFSACIDLYIGSVHTTYCFTDGKNLNGGDDPALAAYKVTSLGDGWYRYEIDASVLAGDEDISAVTLVKLGLAPGNAGWRHSLNVTDTTKDGVMYVDNFRII